MDLKQKIADIDILKNWNQTYNKPESKVIKDSITLDGYKEELTRIEEAEKINSAIGVFGPSQCGKSYLISELIDNAELLIPNVEGRKFQDYNQTNVDAESTAVVTRFTKNDDEKVPDNCLKVKLMSVGDIIWSFVYGFYTEAESGAGFESPNDDDIIQNIESCLNKDENHKLQFNRIINEISNILTYIENISKEDSSLGYRAYGKIMDNQVSLKPSIDLLKALCGSLWKNDENINNAFGAQLEILNRLDFKETIFIEENILEAILDAKTLEHIPVSSNGESFPSCNEYNICTSNNSITNIQTVVREVILPVKTDKSSILNKLDILDFPGARASAGQIDSNINANKIAENIEQNHSKELAIIYKRGKLHYLFELYRKRYDITLLLFCSEPGNQEVGPTLTKLLENWTQTNISDGVEKSDPSLFVALTKSDRLLAFDGEDQIDNKLRNRLDRNFALAYGDWVNNWLETEKPFSNFFMVRNPQAPDQTCVDKSGNNFTWRLGFEEKMEQFNNKYMSDKYVEKYFGSRKTELFEAIFDKPESTGIQFLKEALSRKHAQDPDKKHKLLIKREADAISNIFNYITTNYRNPDETIAAEEERKKAEDFIEKLIKNKTIDILINQVIASCPDFEYFLDMLEEIKLNNLKDKALNYIPSSYDKGIPKFLEEWLGRCKRKGHISDLVNIEKGDLKTYLDKMERYLKSSNVLDEFQPDLEEYFPFDTEAGGVSHIQSLTNFIKWYFGSKITYLGHESKSKNGNEPIEIPQRNDFKDKVLNIWKERLPEIYANNFNMESPSPGNEILVDLYTQYSNSN